MHFDFNPHKVKQKLHQTYINDIIYNWLRAETYIYTQIILLLVICSSCFDTVFVKSKLGLWAALKKEEGIFATMKHLLSNLLRMHC